MADVGGLRLLDRGFIGGLHEQGDLRRGGRLLGASSPGSESGTKSLGGRSIVSGTLGRFESAARGNETFPLEFPV